MCIQEILIGNFVTRPVNLIVLIVIEQRRAGGELLCPDIATAAKHRKKILQIAAFRKPGELSVVVKPHVNERVNLVGFDQVEKITRTFLRITNRKNLHDALLCGSNPVLFRLLSVGIRRR